MVINHIIKINRNSSLNIEVNFKNPKKYGIVNNIMQSAIFYFSHVIDQLTTTEMANRLIKVFNTHYIKYNSINVQKLKGQIND